MVTLFAGLSLARARRSPDASLTLSEGTVAVGIGFSWGKGTLSYKGKGYWSRSRPVGGRVGVNCATATGDITT